MQAKMLKGRSSIGAKGDKKGRAKDFVILSGCDLRAILRAAAGGCCHVDILRFSS
jgi:hypothetical protein